MTCKLMFPTVAICLLALAASVQADTEAARAAYEEAQTLKRGNRFGEAKQAFQRVAEVSGPGDSSWAILAADELRYGLLLHEANTLTVQLAGPSGFPARQQTLQRLDALYRAMLDNNMNNLERISEIERRRDQLAQMRQTVNAAQQINTDNHLQGLRLRVELLRRQTGQWPDRRRLEQELAQTARDAGLATDSFYIVNYYPSSSSFYATIREAQGGAESTLKGDENGLKLERHNH